MARPSREGEILAAALSVFAERGYDGVRVREIAARAGVSEGAIYVHFRSKEALAVALFELHARRYSGALAAIVADRAESVEARVLAVALRSLDAFAEEPDSFAFLLTHQARFIGALPADFPYPIRVLEGLVREGQRERSIRPGPVRLLSAVVFGAIVQPVRTVLDAPAGTISLRGLAARTIVADAAWRSVAAKPG